MLYGYSERMERSGFKWMMTQYLSDARNLQSVSGFSPGDGPQRKSVSTAASRGKVISGKTQFGYCSSRMFFGASAQNYMYISTLVTNETLLALLDQGT